MYAKRALQWYLCCVVPVSVCSCTPRGPNPDTMYTILLYTIQLYGKNRIVEVNNRKFGKGYTYYMMELLSRTT
jgi:hypothetical protein